MERESHILKKEMQELPKMPRELIERFTKETYLNFCCKSNRREAYLLCFLVAFVSRLDSKPTVSSKIYRKNSQKSGSSSTFSSFFCVARVLFRYLMVKLKIF